jgi:hypothetical protein
VLSVDEQSKSFQREVIDTLLKKLIDSLKIDPSTKSELYNQLTNYLDNHQIYSIDSLIQNSSQVARILRINPQSLNEIIQKNYFKIVQQLKKQKESFNLFLKDEKQNIIDIITQHIFPSNLFDSYFKEENQLYILYLPNQKIVERSVSTLKESELTKQENKTQKTTQPQQPLKEEKSILKEILELFPNVQTTKNLAAEVESLEAIVIKEEKQEERQVHITQQKQSDSESILREILTNFSDLFPISKDLQKIIDREEMPQQTEIKSTSDQTEEIQMDFIPIPFTIAEYVDLRKKLQQYKNDPNAYSNFIKTANQNQKSVIAILNIISRENDPNFLLENYLENVSIKLNASKESIRELYYRIKKYNMCIGFLKQAAEHLKKHEPKLHNYFLGIYEPLLDFISLLNGENQEQFLESNIDKNLKLLLISIIDENDRQKLLSFLKRFIFNIRKYL